MSTIVLTEPAAQPQRTRSSLLDRGFVVALITCLTGLSLAIHGYHPYSEDGGLYITGIKRLLDSSLYPQSVAFVEAHLRFSLFAPLVVALVRRSHFSLPAVLLAIHLASIWMTLFAVWLLAARCYSSNQARAGAVTLTAVWLTIPIAGTSLILLDPYVTARSISLPCTIFALAGTLDFMRPSHRRERLQGLALCLPALLLAAIMHPLMAGYALGGVLLLAALLAEDRTKRIWATVSLCAASIVLAATLQTTAGPDPGAYFPVAVSRYYWFLSHWHWYELSGLAAPLVMLCIVAVQPSESLFHGQTSVRRRALASAGAVAGTVAVLIALAFAHESGTTHIVARMQPLRIFQMVYVILIVIIGSALGEYLLRRSVWRWIGLFACLGGLMFLVQRNTYPSSAHVEWPSAFPANRWEQAFIWISQNTPRNALFALDADYITRTGEDAQSFRALAERSALPDYSKDGGEASITPALSTAWNIGQRAQQSLSEETDAQRIAALQPLNVDWIVLQQDAKTGFDCPYTNAAVKVCRLH